LCCSSSAPFHGLVLILGQPGSRNAALHESRDHAQNEIDELGKQSERTKKTSAFPPSPEVEKLRGDNRLMRAELQARQASPPSGASSPQ
jgi:hypothetical protein